MLNQLKKYNQTNIIDIYEHADDNVRRNLEEAFATIDLESIMKIYNNRFQVLDTKDKNIEPIKALEIDSNRENLLFEKGLEVIQKGKAAVVLMAGGQGTRLGHDGPKGTYDIGLPSHKSLFHIQCDKLKRLRDLTGVSIKWYIMTSEDNHDDTVSHFENHRYFGYDDNAIVFFKQDRMPLILEDGNLAMTSPSEVNMAANGNGGVFSSLSNQGYLEQMSKEGVEYVFLYGVDNVLAKVADPVFLAFTEESGHDICSKSVEKTYPEEKVGVMCYSNGKPAIVEYSELNDQLRYQVDDDGRLVYRNANILSHIFRLDFLKKCASLDIPYHVAHKKVDYFDGCNVIKATEPNGYKFELFMFDVFEYANDMSILMVDRASEFAPVKNLKGQDSPESAREMIHTLHTKWLQNSGKSLQAFNEVDTSKSYKGENL